MKNAYQVQRGDHKTLIDPEDVAYEDSVSSDTDDYDNSDPYDLEYDVGPAVFEIF
jgi:hypothetical protein